VISFGVVTGLFAAIYKVLPDVEIRWSDVWIGAAVTALLFTIGKLLIGLYLGNASIGSTYGAAGSLLVVLVWVYYSAQILFFGAEFTQVYARRYGSQIVPSEHAIPLTEEARAQAGMPRKEAVQRATGTGRSVAAARQTVAQPTAMSNEKSSSPDKRTAHHGDALGGYQRPGLIKQLLWFGSLAIAAVLMRRNSTRAHR
jgi:membrane protein